VVLGQEEGVRVLGVAQRLAAPVASGQHGRDSAAKMTLGRLPETIASAHTPKAWTGPLVSQPVSTYCVLQPASRHRLSARERRPRSGAALPAEHNGHVEARSASPNAMDYSAHAS
jgi:hypothetical protein